MLLLAGRSLMLSIIRSALSAATSNPSFIASQVSKIVVESVYVFHSPSTATSPGPLPPSDGQ